jgi:serine/threonine-protein kinase
MSREADKLAAASPVAPGEVVAGKYRIEELVAAGGMGVVVRARHLELEQEVAIKLVLAGQRDPERVARFLREARAAALIQSEHVVRVFDCGRLADGMPYMVMEHLRGSDLRQLLRERGTLAVTEAVDLLLQAMLGVAEAHARGIVHRDLKPANLFCVERRGQRTVKVLDFGISKISASGEEDEDLTRTEVMLGSPRYMAPEQARSARDVDGRADIWSLGVILYEMLDGASPFAGPSMGETLSRILSVDPAPLSVLRPDVPEAMAGVVSRCLQRERHRRYRSVAELARALAPFGSEGAAGLAARVPEAEPFSATAAAAPLLDAAVVPAPVLASPVVASLAVAAAASDAPQANDAGTDLATRATWERGTSSRGRRRSMLLWLAAATVAGGAAVFTITELVARDPAATGPAPAASDPGVAGAAAPLPGAPASSGAASQPPVTAAEADTAGTTAPTAPGKPEPATARGPALASPPPGAPAPGAAADKQAPARGTARPRKRDVLGTSD